MVPYVSHKCVSKSRGVTVAYNVKDFFCALIYLSSMQFMIWFFNAVDVDLYVAYSAVC